MDQHLASLHLAAGRAYGRERTCGTKQRHLNEHAAASAAASLNASGKARHPVEPYPCAWCDLWHVGREMSIEQLAAAAAREGGQAGNAAAC